MVGGMLMAGGKARGLLTFGWAGPGELGAAVEELLCCEGGVL